MKWWISLLLVLLWCEPAFAGWGYGCEHADDRYSPFDSIVYGDECITASGKPEIAIGYGYSYRKCSKRGWRSAKYDEVKSKRYKTVFNELRAKKRRRLCSILLEEENKLYPGFLKSWRDKERRSKAPLFAKDYLKQYGFEVHKIALKKSQDRTAEINDITCDCCCASCK